ncbi:hypothetical protein PFISCL1PPCAC_17189, partial [Pristionchus fissidentatus]
ILFDATGTVKVCDLGIASDFSTEDGRELTKTRTMIGTPLYAAPEQSSWVYNSKVDMFTLGLICVDLHVRMSAATRNKAFDNYRRGLPNDEIVIDEEHTKELITRLTKFHCEERPTCREVLDKFMN